MTAGAGVRVAKHGNRSISSKCGSADVMEALGVNIQLPPERAAQCLREVGICFLYAPDLHSSMKQVQKVRRELRLRTMFNLLGPLTNPAHASGQVVGVYALDMVEKLAEALSMLGLHRALVVHGLDGLDEITITGPTRVAEVRDGSVRTYEVDPEEFGMKRATLEDISGGDAAENAAIIREVLKREEISAPRCGLAERRSRAGGGGTRRSSGRSELPLAAQSIDSGAAAGEAGRFCQLYQKLSGPMAHHFAASPASILNALFVVSLSGTLPSFTTISSGRFGISTRITPLLLPRTTSRS